MSRADYAAIMLFLAEQERDYRSYAHEERRDLPECGSEEDAILHEQMMEKLKTLMETCTNLYLESENPEA